MYKLINQLLESATGSAGIWVGRVSLA